MGGEAKRVREAERLRVLRAEWESNHLRCVCRGTYTGACYYGRPGVRCSMAACVPLRNGKPVMLPAGEANGG